MPKKTRAPQFERYCDAKGEWRWRLRASNGEVIADSAEGYTEKAECGRAITRVRRAANFRTVVVDVPG